MRPFALAAMLAAACTPGPGPSQLERQVVSPSEYGRYTVQTLILLQQVQTSDDLNPSEIRRREDQIKRGIVGRFRIEAAPAGTQFRR